MNKSFSAQQERLHSEILPFLCDALNSFDIRAVEGEFGSMRTTSGKFVHGLYAQGSPLPAQRFLRLHVECRFFMAGTALWEGGVGCAILLADEGLDEIYFADGLLDIPRRVSFEEALDILVERHIALGVTA